LPEKTVTPRNRIILIVTATLCGALALTAVRAHDVPKVATGFVANVLCSETFVSGQDPDSPPILSLPPRSTVPLPSPIIRRSAAPRRWWF